MIYKFMNVTARYPKLNQPYVWSDDANSYVGTTHETPNAAFYCDAFLTNEQWQEADKAIKKVWSEFVAEQEKAGKPLKKPNDFRNPLDEDGEGKGFVKMKLNCYDEKTSVRQLDSKLNKLPLNFELTSGSKINARVVIKAYKSGAQQGITLRLTDVMVIELADKQEAPVDFEADANGGFTYKEKEEAEPVVQEKVIFGDMEVEAETKTESFEDEIPF